MALVCSPAAWNNGQTGNTGTDTKAECSNPPYATHDWIADHAMDLLPTEEKTWLTPHKALYLIGTEAPGSLRTRHRLMTSTTTKNTTVLVLQSGNANVSIHAAEPTSRQ